MPWKVAQGFSAHGVYDHGTPTTKDRGPSREDASTLRGGLLRARRSLQEQIGGQRKWSSWTRARGWAQVKAKTVCLFGGSVEGHVCRERLIRITYVDHTVVHAGEGLTTRLQLNVIAFG